jgi:hypothetical protein
MRSVPQDNNTSMTKMAMLTHIICHLLIMDLAVLYPGPFFCKGAVILSLKWLG